MNTINLKKVGGGVNIIVTEDQFQGNLDLYKNGSVRASIRKNANGSVLVSIDGQDYFVTTSAQLLFEGVTPTDTADMYTKFAALFPDTASGGGGETPIILTDPTSYVLPAGKLLTDMEIKPASDATIKVGTTAGGDDIFPSATVTHAAGVSVSTSVFSSTASITIYFTGLPSGSTVELYTK